MKHRPEPIVMLVLLLSASQVHARDWFVRAGSEGDGTIQAPFKDPYLALEEAGPGDTIHVAQGVYHGKLDAANWVIASPNLTWLGGYNADFTQRDPWRFPSQLRFSKEFHGKNSGTLIEGQGSHENFVLDGFVLDQKEGNEYAPEPDASLSSPRSDPIIRLSAPGTQIRNCVILNGGDGGADLQADGCRIENNLILNISRNALITFRSHRGNPTLIRNNTFLFAWSDSGVGSGGTPAGSALSFWSCDSEFEIVDNIFLGCDNRAIHANQAEQLTLRGNVFWLNGWLNVQVQTQEQELRVDTSNLSDLEDAGLKACQGNVVVNPELTGLEPKWMEQFLDRVADAYPNAKLEDLNAMRHSLGLPTLTAKKSDSRTHFAPPYDSAAALKIVPATLKQGAHPVSIEVKPFPAPPPTVVYEYERATWQQLSESPSSIDGKHVEIAGALGQESSTFPFTGISGDHYRGFEFHDEQERFGIPPMIYVKKGGKAERMVSDLRSWDGRGKPGEKHLVRGVVAYDAAVQSSHKGTIIVDSISTIVESAPIESKPRPVGRDWFVRAGSSGNGSKEEPFKDPFQALDAAKPGDTIHVAEGEYFGKFKSGTWKIKIPYLSLLGGYDTGFTERDPWKHPSRLGYSPGTSGGGSEPYLVGDDDHTGFIFDGFVLDGRDVNRLDTSGNLASHFPEHQLMRLGSPDVVVRNCLLVNAGGPAIEAWGDNMHIENNIILNSNYYAIDIRGVTDHPFIIRNNTILFTWNANREQGSSAGTSIFVHEGALFELDGNIIGYADGQAVLAATDRKRLRIVNNVFTHNRYANFTDLDKVVVDDKSMRLLQEVGFAAADGNVVLDPQMSLDGTWWADYSREGGAPFFARPYDWKAALHLLPHNPGCKAGARPVKLDVQLSQ